MTPARMAKADFVTAVILIAVSVGALVESWRMPRLEHLAVNPYTVPGIVPGLLSGVLILLGIVLLVRSVRQGGWRLDAASLSSAVGARLVLMLLLTLGYAAGLVGRLPFWAATFLFVFLFVLLFEWRAGRPPAGHLKSGAFALVLAVAVAAGVGALFQYVFLVRLP